jgi:hypothetical protein
VSVRKLLKESRLREQSRLAVEAALDARRLRRQAAAEAEAHAHEAEYRLVSILEFDASSSFKKDVLGRPTTLMRPEELLFYHKSLYLAAEEIRLAVACFGDEDANEADRLSRRVARARASAPAEIRSARELDLAIVDAIAALPSVAGTVLTRGDLQATLDNAWREDVAAGRVELPTAPDGGGAVPGEALGGGASPAKSIPR